MVHGIGYETERAASAEAALAAAYARGENDEFVKPTLIEGVDGTIRDEDVVIHFNFRADRARQLTHALVDRDFESFDRGADPPFPTVVTLTEYEGGLPVEVAYPPLVVASLAEVVSGLGWRQFHVAETEKYAHVTYFFNGGVERAWPGEERKLVPSPKVATYDLQPEMSAAGVTDEIVAAVASGTYDLIVANFANPDMVGHTGRLGGHRGGLHVPRRLSGPRRRRGAGGRCGLGRGSGGVGAILAVTADHGNADVMKDGDGNPVTKHSLSPVPFLLAGSAVKGRSLARRRAGRRHAHAHGTHRREPGRRHDRPLAAGGLSHARLALPQAGGAADACYPPPVAPTTGVDSTPWKSSSSSRC